MDADSEVFSMFTGAHRALLLRAHAALEVRIKFTKGGLAALGCQSKDVQRVELASVAFKKMLDDAHDRDRWTYDKELRDIGGQALSILVDALDKVRKAQVAAGVEDPHDTDDTIALAKTVGRQLRAELFPVEPKQEALELDK